VRFFINQLSPQYTIYIAGKVKEVRLLLGEFAGKNQTVREWIYKRLK
jgi:hypothetical protein